MLLYSKLPIEVQINRVAKEILMSIQSIRVNLAVKYSVASVCVKRWVRRITCTSLLCSAVALGAVGYAGCMAIPHVHNIYSAAKLLDGEARGESVQGQKAVFASILTRMTDSRFPSTMHAVVYQPYSNTDKILQYNAMGDTHHEDLSTEAGQVIIIRTTLWYTLNQFGLFYGPREARGAHSYCTPEACERQGAYFGTLARIGQIGNHVFYGDRTDEEVVTVTAEASAAPITSAHPRMRPSNLVELYQQRSHAPMESVRPRSRPTFEGQRPTAVLLAQAE